uniref:Uncharacterized protein n=1 Tax=viral metagenome TaxID=1070528 RepID=A0A6M3IF73_9ZZZZ
MAKKLDHQKKEEVIAALRHHGTLRYASKVCGISVRTLNEEMRRSSIFKARVDEARIEGKTNMGDEQLDFIHSVAAGEVEVKMPRLTAALSIANWSVPGFRGTTQVQGKIDHDVRVITAVPRPKYKVEIENKPQKLLDKGNEKGYNSVEEVIEGEVINE